MPSTLTADPASASIFECDVNEFRQDFNRRSFEFSHHLSSHRLFELPRLIELAQELARKGSTYYDAGEVKVNQRWDESPAAQWSIDETIRRIQNAEAWIILKRADQDPEYNTLLNQCMAEVQSLLRQDLTRVMRVQEAIIFIASPNRITTYHIDRECNFILQIHGDKDISVFDQNDREVLPEEELERFWSVDNNAAVYKEHLQDRATVYRMCPGKAIHVPVNAPHWVKNHNNISVTLSVNFQFREDFPAHVYRANYLLRRLGMSPTPPGVSAWRDGTKRFAMNATYMPARRLYRSLWKHR